MKRSVVGAAAATAIVIAAATASVTVFLRSHSTSAPAVTAEIHADYGALPGYAGLSIDQILDRSMSLPGMKGVVLGAVSAPNVHVIDQSSTIRGLAVTDFVFTVSGFVGRGPTPYVVGSQIVLRIPGGEYSDGTGTKVAVTAENAPIVSAGNTYFIAVRDQGTWLGGNTKTILLATDPSDVFPVVGATVKGEGPWSTFAEPITSFEAHFRQ
jgi:hypothetical protein